jgi:hypothetical protein
MVIHSRQPDPKDQPKRRLAVAGRSVSGWRRYLKFGIWRRREESAPVSTVARLKRQSGIAAAAEAWVVVV